nr:hypothetical protein [Tanacetum cinerariifolium]
MIAQSSALPTVVDEPASPVRDDSQGEPCPTDSGFIADQDSATIAKSSTLPHDSAPRVTSPAADEGSMQQNISELTALCTSLQRQYSELMSKFQAQEEEIGRLKEQVQVLEDREAVATKQSREDAPIKGKSNNKGEAAAERISNDSEEITRVLTSMDAATILTGETNVPTGSGFIPTAGPPATVISTGSEVGPTGSLIVRRRKGKEVIVESDIPKKKKLQEQIDAQVARELEEQQEIEDMRMNEQIARDAEVATIHLEEEIQDAPIKGRSNNEGEAAAERISNNSEEIARVLTSIDATTILAGEIDVPTGSGFIPTAGPSSTVISTGKEQQEKEDMRMNEQIARDAEVARIHAEEEIQGMIESLDKSNETIAKYLKEYQEFASELPLEKKIELISDLVK